MGRHAGRLILICNPNWRLTNSFDLPLEAQARSAKNLISHNHLLLREIIEANSPLTLFQLYYIFFLHESQAEKIYIHSHLW